MNTLSSSSFILILNFGKWIPVEREMEWINSDNKQSAFYKIECKFRLKPKEFKLFIKWAKAHFY